MGAPQHTGNLAHPLIVHHGGDAAAGALRAALLVDHQVLVGAGRDLRQVGHGQHLAVTS